MSSKGEKIKTKLNLGSGLDYLEGWINVDVLERGNPDIKHDLNKYPYPLKPNSIEEVNCFHILEHLDDRFKFLKEILRICKNGAKVRISVPHWSHFLSWSNLQHTRGFSIYSFEEYKGQYTSGEEPYFVVVKKKYEAYSSKAKFIGRIINDLANLSPKITEMFLCKIIPVQAVGFELRVIKKS